MRASVAMCTYNGSRFLREQLDSIAAQTEAPGELVVQDDGSADDTCAMIEAFGSVMTFPVRLFRNERQLGASANFSSCMQRCEGEVVVLSDQDDVWEPDRIARTMAVFHREPATSFVFSDAPLIDERGMSLGRTIFETVPIRRTDRAVLARGADLTDLMLRYGVLYGATMAARADLLNQVLPVPQGWSHDEWLGIALGTLGPSARLEPVVRYRQHAAQSVGAGTAGLASLAASSRSRGPAYYQTEINRYAVAVATVHANTSLPTSLEQALNDKLRFLRKRADIRRSASLGHVRQLLSMLPEYARLGAGPRSMLKDALEMVRRRTPPFQP